MIAIDAHVGRRLAQLTTKAHVSRTSLALQMGVSLETLRRMETGEIRVSARHLFRVSKALDMPLAAFFEGFDPDLFVLAA